MTEAYWQRYKEEYSHEYMNNVDNKFWQGVKADMARRNNPKHHLELYSMCKSENPYIKQIKHSPNITTQTVSELICRDKGCQLQYCLSLQKISEDNRRKPIDLKGCKEQYDTMWNCIRVERNRIEKRQEELKNLVLGIKVEQREIKEKEPKRVIEQVEYI